MSTQDIIKSVYEDKIATINEHDYEFGVMTFTERRTVFAYASKIAKNLESGDLSFIDDSEYKKIEKDIIFKRITYDKMSLSKKNVFEDEEFMVDYLKFVTIALAVISYPFTKGGIGK